MSLLTAGKDGISKTRKNLQFGNIYKGLVFDFYYILNV